MSTINQLSAIVGTAAAGAEMEIQLPGEGTTKKLTLTQLKAALDAIGGDVSAPTVVSAVVNNANPNQVVVTFSESVTVTTAGWSFRRNTTNWVVSSVAGSGTTWTFTMATNASSGETIDRSYDAGTGNTLDAATNELGSFTNASVTNNVAGGFDSDAQAFFTAASITNSTEQNAWNTFVVAAKAAGYYSKIRVALPMLGSAAARTAYDAISKTSMVTWTGSLLHGAAGVTADIVSPPSTSTGWGDINYPLSNLTNHSVGLHFYRGDNNDYGNGYQMGYFAGTNYYLLQTRNSDAFRGWIGSDSALFTTTNTNGAGFHSIVRTANNVLKGYKNGTQVGSTVTTTNSESLPNADVYLFGANNSGSIGLNCPAICACAFITDGLTDGEMTNFNTHVQAFATALGRNV